MCNHAQFSAPGSRSLLDEPRSALRKIWVKTFYGTPLSLTVNVILDSFVTMLFAANQLQSARTAVTDAVR
jgi:hypothetical protein